MDDKEVLLAGIEKICQILNDMADALSAIAENTKKSEGGGTTGNRRSSVASTMLKLAGNRGDVRFPSDVFTVEIQGELRPWQNGKGAFITVDFWKEGEPMQRASLGLREKAMEMARQWQIGDTFEVKASPRQEIGKNGRNYITLWFEGLPNPNQQELPIPESNGNAGEITPSVAAAIMEQASYENKKPNPEDVPF